MKRRNYIATIVNKDTMVEIASTEAYAWNSGIKASEALMRTYARNAGTIFTGSKPTVVLPGEPERQYIREWTSPAGETITASVWESI